MGDGSLRVICGPTAAGKSRIALALAQTMGAAIVSADSRQIYRGFDVGTAKPTPEERRRVPHYGIDVAAPTERFSAGAWADAAAGWLAASWASGRAPLVVGGTGFYLRALADPIAPGPPLDPVRRRALERYLVSLPTAELRRWCVVLDPARASLGRAQLMRAVETALLAGRRLSAAQDEGAARRPRRPARYLYVDPGRALGGLIEERVGAMLAGGWEAEVVELLACVPPDAPAWNAAGYGTVRSLVAGAIGRDAARGQIVVETRQYAKRQRTWFRHQLPPGHVTPLDPFDPDAPRIAERWWRNESLA